MKLEFLVFKLDDFVASFCCFDNFFPPSEADQCLEESLEGGCCQSGVVYLTHFLSSLDFLSRIAYLKNQAGKQEQGPLNQMEHKAREQHT